MSFMHALYNMNPLATANWHQPGHCCLGWRWPACPPCLTPLCYSPASYQSSPPAPGECCLGWRGPPCFPVSPDSWCTVQDGIGPVYVALAYCVANKDPAGCHGGWSFPNWKLLMAEDVLPLEFLAMVATISKVVSDLTLKPPWNITGFSIAPGCCW